MELQVSPLTSGTIIKVYNSNRGQDYVVLGQSKREGKLVLAKNNAITNDGTLFKQTKLYTLDIVALFKETDPFYFVPKVRRVVGHRSLSEIKKTDLSNLSLKAEWYAGLGLEKLNDIIESFELLKIRDEVYPPIDTPDIKKVVNY